MRSEKLVPLLLVGLLAVQTVLLTVIILRLNELQALVVRGSGAVGGAVSDERIEVDPGDGPSKGEPGAPVTIVEFSDFTCSACAELQPALRAIVARHPDRVRLAFRYFPLSTQGKPMLFATAAECAHRQGKFWEVHDLLFEKGRELGTEAEVRAAVSELGLDLPAFDQCRRSGDGAIRPRTDYQAGKRYGVEGTPTLFINGRRTVGSDAAAIERLIAAEL